jgi:hypothetical protein
MVRRVSLETRHYLLRENAYFLAYTAGRRLAARKIPARDAAVSPSLPAL